MIIGSCLTYSDSQIFNNAANALIRFVEYEADKSFVDILNIFINILIRIHEMTKAQVLRIFNILIKVIDTYLDVTEQRQNIIIGKFTQF